MPVLPPSTIGIFGSGQLGRMLALAARRMGYGVRCYSPDRDSPTGQVADVEVVAGYENREAVAEFARGVDVLTFEFENVPAGLVEEANRHTVVRPSGHLLHVSQNRVREKAFLAEHGIPVTPFGPIETARECEPVLARVGLPAILKTASFGYDGKGQQRIDDAEALRRAWSTIAPQPAILERVVEFTAEVSVVVARGATGHLACFDVIENTHVNHILDVSVVPARVPEGVRAHALDIARRVAIAFDLVGLLCVEMFVTGGGGVLVNEIAPRPHNSGHFSVDAAVTSQFEQQLRAVCGLPLGSTRLLAPAAMVNLLGDLWAGGEPAWERVCAMSDVKLHLYGKREARPGRKMGHLTVMADTPAVARDRALAARAALTQRE